MLDVPPPPTTAEAKVESEAIARVVWLSRHQRQHLLANFRDPCIRSDRFAAEVATQESVCMLKGVDCTATDFAGDVETQREC